MKNINYLNYAFVGIPLLMMGGGWLFDSGIVVQGMLLPMATGLFQVIVGIVMFVKSGYRNPFYGAYLLGVFIFFLLWNFTDWQVLVILPPLLAIYFSTLLFFDAYTQEP